MALLAALIACYLFVYHHPELMHASFLIFGPVTTFLREPPVRCTAVGGPVGNTTQLKVVLPALSQTGTTSVLQALRQLGYRSYHDEETRSFIPSMLLAGELFSAQAT
eukprot:2146473-Alexandrium_andersonii.AAC.1